MTESFDPFLNKVIEVWLRNTERTVLGLCIARGPVVTMIDCDAADGSVTHWRITTSDIIAIAQTDPA